MGFIHCIACIRAFKISLQCFLRYGSVRCVCELRSVTALEQLNTLSPLKELPSALTFSHTKFRFEHTGTLMHIHKYSQCQTRSSRGEHHYSSVLYSIASTAVSLSSCLTLLLRHSPAASLSWCLSLLLIRRDPDVILTP